MSPRQGPRTRSLTVADARIRRQQARAFLEVAGLVLDEPSDTAQPHVAAALAVLAGIAASDAICGLRIGRCARGQDHAQAVQLLEAVDLPDRSLPGRLRRLLAAKDRVHYSAHLMTQGDARTLVKQAVIMVEAAERL